ncbi:LacI family DNA-binding transcriptional regulator [Marinoscillum sp.]|uniref:LacI family DNA-binding transcriptional regulator n=1 Tax=Marinoscillum sp. TaxID=2024838 RepID=UPI003BAA4214
MKRVATIKDIASALEVSTSTVSRILNGKNQSNARLVKDVKAMARKLNYQVNTAAKGLRTNKTKLIGIIVPEIGDDFFAAILSGMQEASEELGYNLLVCQSNESKKKENQLVKSLVACNVEGILIAPSKETHNINFLKNLTVLGKQAVIFDRTIEQDVFPHISFDDAHGGYMGGKYLIALGHRKLLFIGLSQALKNGVARLSGYNKALDESGLPHCKVSFLDSDGSASEILEEHWKEGAFDAVVCYNDLIGAQVIAHFNEIGVKVPKEVSVLGFDNRPLCEYTFPKLSSIEHSTNKMGRMAVTTLLDLLNETESEPLDIEPKLIVRNSVEPKA